MSFLSLLKKFIASVHSFFDTFFFKSGIARSTEWSTIPACPGLMCFFNTGDTEGTNPWKILSSMFVYVLCQFVYRTDFVAFEDLRAE